MSGSDNKNGYRVGRLAALGKVGLGTVRHYQKLGLLPLPPRPKNGGARTYSKDELNRLLLIRNTQLLGFSLKEIGEILFHRNQNDCQQVQRLCAEKQQTLQNQIREQEARLRSLQELAGSCGGVCDKSECRFFQQLACLNLEALP